MFCSNCGKKNIDTAKFCIACGKEMNGMHNNLENGVINSRKKWARIGVICALIIVLIAVWGVMRAQKNSENNPQREGYDTLDKDSEKTNNDDGSLIPMVNNEEVIFSDPLIERCVRLTLHKDDNDKISIDECAGIETLLIDCDMNIGYAHDGLSVYAFNYIDLSDLKYMTNLRELIIDNHIKRDMIVNLDSITHCMLLESLSVRYSPTNFGGLSLGYKYLSNIINQLPNLKYLDLGYIVAEEHKQLLLANNKELELAGDRKYERSNYSHLTSLDIRDVNYISVYTDGWKYGYDMDVTEREISRIRVDSEAQLQEFIEMLPIDIEDIYIYYGGNEPIDVGQLSKFPHLKTLSIIHDEVVGVIDTCENVVQIMNVDKLAGNKELYALNLCKVRMDMEEVAVLTQLQEFAVIGSMCDNIGDIGKLINLKELTALYNNSGVVYSILDNASSYTSLKYLCIEDAELQSCKGIENIPQLDTLIISNRGARSTCSITLEDIAKCSCLKRLIVGVKEDMELNLGRLNSLKTLECLEVENFGTGTINGISEMVSLPNIASFVYRDYQEKVYSELEDWINSASNNPVMSFFGTNEILYAYNMWVYSWQNDKQVVCDYFQDRENYYKRLSGSDILCKGYDTFMLYEPDVFPTYDSVISALDN